MTVGSRGHKMIKQLITTIDTALTELEGIFGVTNLAWYAIENCLEDGFEVSNGGIRYWVDGKEHIAEVRGGCIWRAEGHTLALCYCYDGFGGKVYKIFNDDNKREEF